MTIIRDGEVVAFYLGDQVVCPSCAGEGGPASCDRAQHLRAEELEGAIDELRCDRCGAGISSFH